MLRICLVVNPLSANPTKWSHTLKQFVGKLPTNYLSVCDHIRGVGAQMVKNPLFNCCSVLVYSNWRLKVQIFKFKNLLIQLFKLNM